MNQSEAGKVIARLFKKVLKNIVKEKEMDYYLCKVCGFVVENDIRRNVLSVVHKERFSKRLIDGKG